jgi:lysophospholipase L1-like esterase
MTSPEQPVPVQARKQRWWIGPLLTAISLLIAVGLLEVAAWVCFKYRMPPSLAKRLVELAAYGETKIPQSIAPHPYLLYVNQPGPLCLRKPGGIPTGALLGSPDCRSAGQIDLFGLRGPEIQKEKKPGVLRILFLGGSTTYSVSVADYRDTWPWQLGQMIQKETELSIEVLNAGLPYATTAENLAAYVFRYRYLQPDVVVIETGLNDQVATWYPNYDPEYTHFRSPGAWWNPTPREKRLLRSNIAKIVYVYWLNRFVNVYSAHPYQYELLDRRETLERVRTNSMEGFRRNLDLLVTLAKSDGRGVLLVGPLQARQENLAKGRPELQGMEQILEEGIERHRAVIQEIARARQVQMVAPRIGQFRDEMFTDNAHLTPAGEKVKAGEVLPALKQLIEERGR